MKTVLILFLLSATFSVMTETGSARAEGESDIVADAGSYLRLVLRLIKPGASDNRGIRPYGTAKRKSRISLKAIVAKASLRYSIKKSVILAVIKCESNFDSTALSIKGARGLMQIMPETALDLGVDPGRLYDPTVNINAGTKYVRFLSNRYNGRLDIVAAAYNAGPGRVDSRRPLPTETRRYVTCVRKMYHHYALQKDGVR